jgi:hypothetical protein
LAYHSDQPAFPHQTTGDQWFDESQFESYRRLGCHIAGKALSSCTLEGNNREKFFHDLYEVWYPPSRAVDKNSPAHGEIYMRVLDAVRREEKLDTLDPELFRNFPAENQWTHNSGHVCNSLIQLMERVFYDLGLEDSDERRHPYVRGWLNIFEYWVSRDTFEKTWQVTENSYPQRFQEFYKSLRRKDGKKS